jgi:IclR family transcriptional regulator, acetate operon repressor
MTRPERGGGVQSLDRAFALLEHMAAAGGDVALSELAMRSGLPLPTIHRIVRTLVASGYVRQLPSRRYALGPRLIGLGDAASRMLGEWARPQLAMLVEQVGETANMAMLEGDAAVYVAQAPSAHSMRMFTEVGRRVMAHCTGVGKVLLSRLDDAAVLRLVRRTGLPAMTDHTITAPERLLAELARVRAQGFAVDDGEQEVGVRCLAVPVFGIGDSVAAISVSAPEGRLEARDVERILPEMLRISAALSGDFITSASRRSTAVEG